MKLKSYTEYKDSKVEWIGEIPEGWIVNKIKNTSYVKGRIGWHGLSSEEYADEGAYLVTGTDLKSGEVSWETCHHISWERYKEDPYIHLREDDLLITKDGTIGKVAVVNNLPDKATLNSGIFVVRPLKDDYIPGFMYWILNSSVFKRYFDYIKTGATIAHLYQETFERFFFPIPSETEQIKITNFLDKKTSEIDLTIEKDTRLIELLKEKRTALINHVVTKGLDPTVNMKNSGVEWIGKIPEDWEVSKIKNVSERILTGKTPPTDREEYYDKEELNWFTPGDLGNNLVLPKSSKRISKLAVFDNKVIKYKPFSILLVGIGATLGKVGLSVDEGTSNQQINTIEFCQNKIRPKYSLYYLYGMKNLIISLSNSSTIGIFNQTQTGNFIILKPPIDEQKRIIDKLDEETSKIDLTIQKIQDNIFLLEEYKKSLIHHVVTGKVDVREVAV